MYVRSSIGRVSDGDWFVKSTAWMTKEDKDSVKI